MDGRTKRKILTAISDAQYAHAPDKDRDDESTYRFHEGVYEGLQMAFDIVESVERAMKEEQRLYRLEYNRKYKEAHRAQACQTAREYRRKYPEKVKEQKARYRAKQRQKRLEGRETDG